MKKKEKDLLTYAGIGLAAVLLLPKLLRKPEETSAEGADTPLSANTLDIYTVKALMEQKSDKGQRIGLYVGVSNPMAAPTVIDSIEGSIHYGPYKIASANLGKFEVDADGAMIPVVFIFAYNSLPNAASSLMKANDEWIKKAYFKGTIRHKDFTVTFKKYLEPIKSFNEISGVNRLVTSPLPYSPPLGPALRELQPAQRPGRSWSSADIESLSPNFVD